MFHRLYFAFMAVLTLLCSCSSDRPDSLEPHLQTLQATDITRTEATISGVCQTDKGTQMPQLWFRYGADESMSERSDVLDNVDGSVSMRLRNLTAGTTYYYMLQGGNGTAVLSGEPLSFTTLPNLQPTMGEVKVLSSSPMSVIVGYSIADDGGDDITESGCRVVRQDGADMDGGSEKQITIMQTGSVSADGLFRLRIGNMQPNTTYVITPFASNRNGEAVGEPLSYTTSSAVILDKPGMLSVVIGGDIYKYTTITIAGPLNGDDLRTLRHMAGLGIDGSATDGRLADIDISGARIVAGGGTYDASRYSEDNAVGVGLFASCVNLKNINLPMDVVRIEKDAFLNCSSLRSIVIPASVDDEHKPRMTTLNALSRYIGHPDFSGFVAWLKTSPCYNSSFFNADQLMSSDLRCGDEVEIGWSPNRMVRLEYLGNSRYTVIESRNSKMLFGDVFVTGCFIAEQPLYLPFLERDGERTPPFVAGRNGGLSIVRILKTCDNE